MRKTSITDVEFCLFGFYSNLIIMMTSIELFFLSFSVLNDLRSQPTNYSVSFSIFLKSLIFFALFFLRPTSQLLKPIHFTFCQFFLSLSSKFLLKKNLCLKSNSGPQEQVYFWGKYLKCFISHLSNIYHCNSLNCEKWYK